MSNSITLPISSTYFTGLFPISRLPTSILIALSLLLSTYFSSYSYANKALVEPSSGDMEFIIEAEGNKQIISGLHLDSRANITISGMIATVELTQEFRNPSNQWVEGRYVFPLPENSAVNAMEMKIGERLIKGLIKEKKEAKKIYNNAKAAGKKTSLLEQHRPNLFSQKVANIAPRETIIVTLRYLQPINYDQGLFSLRFPMTLTPRYIPSTSNLVHHENESTLTTNDENIDANDKGWGWSSPTNQAPDAHLITPMMTHNNSNDTPLINPITLEVALDAGLPLAAITSAYHNITITKDAEQHNILLSNGTVSMDRDFVLSWQAAANSTPKAAIFNETIDGDDYSLIMLMPPSKVLNLEQQGDPIIKKEAIFIIDTSGSMGGTSIKQAKSGLQYALKQLSPQDRFNIIEFNSDFSSLHTEPVIANQSNIKQALRFVGRLQAGGGTEMLGALTEALQQPHQETYLKQIIFITDGSVGNEEQLFRRIHASLKDARLFTVGIGSAPNSFFMRKAAEFGRGSFTYIGDINEVNEKMKMLFKKINTPTMRDIVIEDSQGRPLNIFPSPLPDLYEGEPLIAAVHKDYEADTLVIKGRYQQQVWQQQLTFNHGKNHSGVANLWARKKIESLLDKERTGKNANNDKEKTIKEQVIDVALRHQLMSPYTSFVAVEEVISRPSEQSLNKNGVPNTIPQGQTLQTIPYPQTATPLWLHSLLGLLAAIISACFYCLHLRQKREEEYSHA